MSDECKSRYTVDEYVILECVQHLGGPGREKHSARYWNIRWYWSDEEADDE